MSKNIVIEEGGSSFQFTVDKLKTSKVGGGSVTWIPEDEVQLTKKTVTQNGKYKASYEGYYGYAEFTVNLPNEGTATGTDDDGDEVVAHTDPQTDKIVVDKVPSRIEVITPPTNPYGIYPDGSTISTEGMVVKAYYETGGEYGTVPNGEITLEPTTAEYDATTDMGARGSATSDLVSGEVIFNEGAAIAYSPTGQGWRERWRYNCEAVAGFASSEGRINLLKASKTSPAYEYYETWADGTIHARRTGGTTPYTYDDKTVYFEWSNNPDTSSVKWAVTKNSTSGDHAKLAWTMIYGTVTELPHGSVQEITVQWPRPLDGKILETTFEILVAPGYGGEGESAGALPGIGD